MEHWNIVLRVPSIEMLERGVDVTRNPVSPVSSGDRKRSLSAGGGYDDSAKRRITDVYSTMSLPTNHRDTGISSPRPSYGGVHTSSYPVSSLNYPPSQRDDEVGYNGFYSSQSWSSFVDVTSQRSNSSYRQLAESNGNYDRSTKAGTSERNGFPSYDTSYTEQGYPGQYDFHEYPDFQELGDGGRRNDEGNPSMPSYVPPPTKRNEFNLSRYQLDDDEDLFASIPDQPAVVEDAKPNRFKTQRERLMLARADESEDSDSTAPGFQEACQSQGGEDSSSRDSIMSQSERLRQFRNEHSHHVVIPNQWEGEKSLHEFVSFGNIEAALRPLGLMMARTALVNDSVPTRHHRSSSSGPSGCHSRRSNPLQAQ